MTSIDTREPQRAMHTPPASAPATPPRLKAVMPVLADRRAEAGPRQHRRHPAEPEIDGQEAREERAPESDGVAAERRGGKSVPMDARPTLASAAVHERRIGRHDVAHARERPHELGPARAGAARGTAATRAGAIEARWRATTGGRPPARKSARQPNAGSAGIAISPASVPPSGTQTIVTVTASGRCRAGTYSAASAAAFGIAPPSPRPVRNRNVAQRRDAVDDGDRHGHHAEHDACC